ncbi:hypothetical protein F1D05_12220 [Kribbella qitaiheensis]|uniref:DUF559 domain-containing protein n=1 Tax=Kribbella qitaiheensis TaxID=1544730 RepID=A0A7G6WX16_9ACTN|nr:hypothetical protein [Kribbella qitaiheensis]QNE18531.1 hypothetical protein F1D05_12220 [Kribbella qitaiheensis]
MHAQVLAGRWAIKGRQTIAVTTGELPEDGEWWTAVFEVGSGAALDGATALKALGLKGFDGPIHISTPKSARPRHPRGVVVHETRRRQATDLALSTLPRVRPSVAAIRAALWAISDKQASLLLVMSVQQRLTTPAHLAEALMSIRRHRRRRLLDQVTNEIAGGAQSTGEIDFLRLGQEYGLPEPDRQSRRVTPDGIAFLDVEWTAYEVVVEIEGVHHQEADRALADALRQNELTIDRSRVLRIPVVGLRTDPARFLDQVARLLRSQGWPG